jgi:hypothetical protein
MSSDWTTSGPSDKQNALMPSRRNISGRGKLSNKRSWDRRSTIKSSDDESSTEGEGFSFLEEVQEIIENVIDRKFARIERQMKQMEEKVEEQMNSCFKDAKKDADEKNDRMLETLTSMVQAVECTGSQGKEMQDSIIKSMDSIGANLDKHLVGLGNVAKEVESSKMLDYNITSVVNNIEDTINKKVIPLINDTHKFQEGTFGEGKQFKETLEKVYNVVMITNQQNLENLSNIMESLGHLTQETSKIDIGIDNILNCKLTDDFLQGMCQMMVENKTILENLVDKKALSSINNTINDIKLSDVKVNIQLKELKTICSNLCTDTTFNVLSEEIKTSHEKHVDLVADIKKYEGERFDDVKNTLQKLQKAQNKVAGKQQPVAKKKPDENSDDASVHSMLLQMDINKANAETTRLLNKIETRMQEMSETQVGHNNWMTNLRTKMDTDFNTLTKKLDTQSDIQVTDASVVDDKIRSCLLQNSGNMLEEFKKYSNIQTEILNSIEDLKILTSSMPNTVNDLLPLVEKAFKGVDKFPDEVNSCLAGLEENLCANLEGSVKQISCDNLKEICDRFDTMEQRLLVIRKYVKHGNGGSSNQSEHGNDVSRDEIKDSNISQQNGTISSILEKVDAVHNTVEMILSSSFTIQNDTKELGTVLSSFSDLKENVSDEKNQVMVHKVISTYKDSLDLPLTCIRDVQYQILEQQAKVDDQFMEEQFMALTGEINKAIENNLVAFCEKSIQPIISEQNNFKQLSQSGTNFNDFVQVLSSMSQMEDRITKNQSEILQNLRNTLSSRLALSESGNLGTNKDDIVCINVLEPPSEGVYKQPSLSVKQSKQSRNVCSETICLESDAPFVRQGRQTLMKNYSSSTPSKMTRDNSRGTSTSSIQRKRSPSSSTDDSILDTNSDAQDPGEITGESLKILDAVNKKSNLDRKPRHWGPKRRRPDYVESDTKSLDENSFPDKGKQRQLSKWSAKGFGEQEFDGSSIVSSEDIFM